MKIIIIIIIIFYFNLKGSGNCINKNIHCCGNGIKIEPFNNANINKNATTNEGVRLHERRNVQGLQCLNNKNETENNFCNYSIDALSSLALLKSFYEPPKPDTPPSKIIPFWIDPIWSSTDDAQNVESVSNQDKFSA